MITTADFISDFREKIIKKACESSFGFWIPAVVGVISENIIQKVPTKLKDLVDHCL